MLLKIFSVITVLMYCSRPGIMPLVEQDTSDSVKTKNRDHIFVKELEKLRKA